MARSASSTEVDITSWCGWSSPASTRALAAFSEQDEDAAHANRLEVAWRFFERHRQGEAQFAPALVAPAVLPPVLDMRSEEDSKRVRKSGVGPALREPAARPPARRGKQVKMEKLRARSSACLPHGHPRASTTASAHSGAPLNMPRRPVKGSPISTPRAVMRSSRKLFFKIAHAFLENAEGFGHFATQFQIAQEDDVIRHVINAYVRHPEVAGDGLHFIDQQHGHTHVLQVFRQSVEMGDQLLIAHREAIAERYRS